jgi:xylose isomerase
VSSVLAAQIAEVLDAHQKATGINLLWGTANLFSHPRYMCGAGTNPQFSVYAHAGAQVKKAMEITHKLCGKRPVVPFRSDWYVI